MAKFKSREDFSVRSAGVDDFTAVLNINRNVYDGFDYMPGLFHTFIHDPNTRVYIADLDGQTVALDCVEITDKNHCALLAGRTMQSVQGKGAQAALLEKTVGFANPLLERPRKGMATAVYNPKYHHKYGVQEVVQKWNVLAYKTTSTMVNTAVEQLQNFCRLTPRPKQLSLEETIHIITSKETMDLLKRHGDYIVYYNTWRPRKIDEYNLRIIAQQSNVLFSFQAETSDATKLRMADGVSFTNITPCSQNKTRRVDIYYYGNPMINQWASHILFQFERMMKIFPHPSEKFNIICHFPLDLDVQSITVFLKPYFRERFQNDVFAKTTACVLQMNLDEISELLAKL